MNKINFQDEFLKKFEVESRHPLKTTSNGYCLYHKSVPYSFIDFFNPPAEEYKYFLLDVQYYGNYLYSSTKNHITFRLENLFNYKQRNNKNPHIISLNGYADYELVDHQKYFQDFIDSNYVFAYVDYDMVSDIDTSKINELRYVYSSSNFKYKKDNLNILTLEIPLLHYNKDNIKEIESLYNDFDNIILRDVTINHDNRDHLINYSVYKNLSWYVSSYKILDTLLQSFFLESRLSALFYWSSEVDRLLNDQYEGHLEFNFLDTDNNIFTGEKNIIS